jgi:regulator of PEP synthase PpsR (kinase-PPPase family)
MQERTVFFVSDRTGITAETLGISLISQFEGIHFKPITLPFVDSTEKALEVTNRINACAIAEQTTPLVFSTIVDPAIRSVLQNTQGHCVDFFQSFIPDLETTLGVKAHQLVGRVHGTYDKQAYNTRIDAVNFALAFDDGARTTGYDSADIILIGVSRCGKTPTCLYLAMQFGIRAANYPLTEEDLDQPQLPSFLESSKAKLFGLTIDPLRLASIRAGRKPNSRYADLQQCIHEIKAVESLFKKQHIPYLSATHLSIEELATKMLVIAHIDRRLR